MSKSFKVLFAIGLVSLVVACSGAEEEVVIIQEPIVAEPTMNKF
jgi:hypothetical protein